MPVREASCPQIMHDGSVCSRAVHAKGLCALHWSRSRSGLDMSKPVAAWTRRQAPCSIGGCEFIAYARGLCAAHYQRQRQGLTVDAPIKRKGVPLVERVRSWLAAASPNGDCLIAPRIGNTGYATSTKADDGKYISGHRAVYITTRGGPIPKWAQVHHVCGNRACINPDHLVLASQKENMAEMHGRREFERRIAALEEQLSRHHCAGCCCSAENTGE